MCCTHSGFIILSLRNLKFCEGRGPGPDNPKTHFFNTHGFTNTTYFTPETLKDMIKEINDISFSSFILISEV